MKENTIAAISSAQGEGGISVIRISGQDAIEVASRVFSAMSGKSLTQYEGYRAAYGKILENDEVLDEAVAIVYRAPLSYTGENVVELCCHGGLFVTRQVLRVVLSKGAVLAEPGEFTKRAFLNGKMDLLEAQSVMNIISAQNRQAVRCANSVREGKLSKKIISLKDTLVNLAAHLSAWADYPEEDIPEVTDTALLSDLKHAKSELSKLVSDFDKGKAVTKGVDTVIVGKPNVGKSTLMNLLAGMEKSIVTEIPGTTRDVVEETVIVGDVVLRLSDTAGIRETDNPVERIGVLKAKEKLSTGSLILAVFDLSTEFTSEDKELVDLLCDIPTVAILNKTDLSKSFDDSYIKENIKSVVYLSAKEGDGREELENALISTLGTADFNPSEGILSSERERQAVINAVNALTDAENTLTFGFSLDAVTVCIEEAIEVLLTLTGENISDEIVDKVFHNFCLGK
ncbi:MAG: tRNA uridine-5-carboxymethylaminomethyl(34) synthesis GTPase MnmE [Eubacteriales bacterium]|nr:tRNA uridine-5-carboxymethylaminomethyl(34) synthesis GTPase MnmE [Eubacteriales bacterium]